MILRRNVGGWWIAKYNGALWHTGTRDIAEAIGYAFTHRRVRVVSSV